MAHDNKLKGKLGMYKTYGSVKSITLTASIPWISNWEPLTIIAKDEDIGW